MSLPIVIESFLNQYYYYFFFTGKYISKIYLRAAPRVANTKQEISLPPWLPINYFDVTFEYRLSLIHFVYSNYQLSALYVLIKKFSYASFFNSAFPDVDFRLWIINVENKFQIWRKPRRVYQRLHTAILASKWRSQRNSWSGSIIWLA